MMTEQKTPWAAEVIKRIENETEGCPVMQDVPMEKYTSFRAGGRAVLMAEPGSAEDLAKVLRIAYEADIPHMLLGNGSNILVRDGGYNGLMIRPGSGFSDCSTDGTLMRCGSACLLSTAAKKAAEASLTGLEFASGIPGSIGGAVFMNAGAYGGEIAGVLKGARVISADGSEDRYMTAEELDLGYRRSILQESLDAVVYAEFELTEGDEEEIRRTMAELTAKRNEKQPVNYPSAGSFFKRPEGYFAGKLVQDAGLKGLSVGGAEVSRLHSGFIINKGGATAADIIQLMEIVQARVFDEFGVKLEPEVRIIGDRCKEDGGGI